MTVLGATTGQALWYLSRGTGLVTLILLTASVVLGILNVRRWHSQRWPRFVVDALHRNVSLIVVGVLGVHVLTSIIDGYAPISVVEAVIPFVGVYRPVWMGLGAVALDLLAAITITSLLRPRFGQRAWRLTHWLAYACWPVALVHGLGTGSDTKAGWVLAVTLMCVLAVLAAGAVRALAGWPARRDVRGGAMVTLVLGPLALLVWLPGGPLGKNWARRAGTPASLLASSGAGASSGRGSSRASARSADASGLTAPFSANLSGTVRQGQTAGGDVAVDLLLNLAGAQSRRLEAVIRGPSDGAGGVQMTSSVVTLGTIAQPDLYRGTVTSLQGGQVGARVSRSDGQVLRLGISLSVDAAGGTATGTVTAQPGAGGNR